MFRPVVRVIKAKAITAIVIKIPLHFQASLEIFGSLLKKRYSFLNMTENTAVKKIGLCNIYTILKFCGMTQL